MNRVRCFGCGGRFPGVEGPVHSYMESSPGCWATFGEVLAREYGNTTYLEVHRLTVDAYAVQHPGSPSRQSIQSVGVHLIRLCLFLEHGLTAEHANDAMLKAVLHKHAFVWLDPPPAMGPLTVADVMMANSISAHKTAVRAWAESAWQAWSPHHDTIRTWLAEVDLALRTSFDQD